MSTTKFLNILMIAFFSASVLFISCKGGGDKKDTSVSEDTRKSDDKISGMNDLEKAAKKMEEAAERMEKGQRVDPVNFRELKKILPEKLAGMERVSHTGESMGMMGMKISSAEAKYKRSNSSKQVKVEIVDTGGIYAGGMGMAMAAWAMMEMDKEDDNGYEKSTIIDGNKAFEQYKYNRKSGEIAVLVDGRFIVTASADDVEMNFLKKVIKEMDMKDLKKLA